MASEVKIVKIDRVVDHPNADRLEIARVGGWEAVIGKNQFKSGDEAVYIPVDSVIPDKMAEELNVKSMLSKGRVRTVKLRGVVSQGLLILPPPDAVPDDNLAEYYGITKYEPVIPPQLRGIMKKRDPFFIRYSMENLKNDVNAFSENDIVYITEKLDGTNFRCTMKNDKTFLVGSHNINLKKPEERPIKNLYWRIAEKYDLERKAPEGYQMFGEIIGPGLNNNYSLKEHRLYIFDFWIPKRMEFLGPKMMRELAEFIGLEPVPLIYEGKFPGLEWLKDNVDDISKVGPSVREGLVITSKDGRKRRKFKSAKYEIKKGDKGYK